MNYQDGKVGIKKLGRKTFEDRVICYNPDGGQVIVIAQNPYYKKPAHTLIEIKNENDRLYKEINQFEKIHIDEDILYNHNQFDQYMVMKMDEFISELQSMNEQLDGERMRLNDCDIRSTKIKGKKYYRVTFTHEKCSSPSRIEAVFGHMTSGFTYIFKEKVFKENKDRILECVEHKKTEFGKHTRWDINGNVYNKKDRKKGKRGHKVSRKQNAAEDV